VTRATRVLALCGLLAAIPPTLASAEWQFTPMYGFTFGGDTSLALNESVGARRWNFGGSVRLLGAGPFGVESVFVYVPGFFEPSPTVTASRSLALMGNVVLTIPRAWNEYGLRPFVSAGLGLLHASHNDPVLPISENLPGYNVGGGAVGFLTDRVGLRFDLRYYGNLKPTGDPAASFGRVRLHYWTGSVGVVFKY
jgi:hypothetical protein